MKNSILLGISLSISLLLTLIVAADATDDIMSITFENITADASSVFPASLGFVVYAADTGKLLFTTSQVADNHEIMREIGGAGNYIVIRTQDPNWCTDLTLDECRRNAHFLSETAFSLQEVPPVPADAFAETDGVWEDIWIPAVVPVTPPFDPSLHEDTTEWEEVSWSTADSGGVGAVSPVESWVASAPSPDATETAPEPAPENPVSLDVPSEPVSVSVPESESETPAIPEMAVPEESAEAQWAPSPASETPSPDSIPDEASL